jgi:hypothetical protein
LTEENGYPVNFELTEPTRQALNDYLKAAGKHRGQFLFTGRRKCDGCMTMRQYARLLAEWLAGIGLDSTASGHLGPAGAGNQATTNPACELTKNGCAIVVASWEVSQPRRLNDTNPSSSA